MLFLCDPLSRTLPKIGFPLSQRRHQGTDYFHPRVGCRCIDGETSAARIREPGMAGVLMHDDKAAMLAAAAAGRRIERSRDESELFAKPKHDVVAAGLAEE